MIITDLKDKLFFIDLFLHLEFSFIVITIIYHIITLDEKHKKIEETVDKVLKTNIFDNLTTGTTEDEENLKILKRVYSNFDKVESFETEIKRNTYLTIILIVFLVIFPILYLRTQINIYTFLLDKLTIFTVIACGLLLFEKLVKTEYKDVMEEDVYNIIKERRKKLKSGTSI